MYDIYIANRAVIYSVNVNTMLTIDHPHIHKERKERTQV